jgi:hypothetical protein
MKPATSILSTQQWTAMNPKAEFFSLVDELRFYILSFLPWQDILRCASVSYVIPSVDCLVEQGSLTIRLTGM